MMRRAIALLCAATAVSAAAPARAVIFGAACEDTVADAEVALLFSGRINFGDGVQDLETVLCSGVRVAPRVVLTAAHCVVPEALGATFVEGAAWSVSREADLREHFAGNAPPPADAVSAVSVHPAPGFDPDAFLAASGLGAQNDLAVVILESPIDGPPLTIVEQPPGLSAQLLLVGHGSTDPAGAVAGATGQRRCVTSIIAEANEDEVRAGVGESSGRRCEVDSGGPTFLRNSAVLVALGSRAYDPDQGCALGSVETRVEPHLSFIDETVAAAGLPPLRPSDDAGPDAGQDAGRDAGRDADRDAGADAAIEDAGGDAGADEAGPDAGAPDDEGRTCGCDAGGGPAPLGLVVVLLSAFALRPRASSKER